MRDILVVVRRLALAGIVLSALAVPLGAVLLGRALSSDIGDNELGDIIAFGLALVLLVLGAAGLILGSALAVLAKRSLADPVEIRGSRRNVLALGLTVAAGQVLIAVPLGAALFHVGFSAAFASGFLVVALASRRRVDLVPAGVLSLALLGVGVFVLWGQASSNDRAAQQRDRGAVIFIDMSVAIDAAAIAAPDDWAVAALAAKATDLAPNEQLRFLPATLVGHPLRGLIVVDCAGSESLEVVARDGDAPAVLGTAACSSEPQIVTIEIPDFTVHTDASATYVLGIQVDDVNQGPTGGMNRALLLVAPTGTSDPDQAALLASFVAAFGTEEPR